MRSSNMKRIVSVAILGLSMGAIQAIEPADEWKHIVDVTKQISTDNEVQESINNVFIAIENALSLSVNKISKEISASEKEKLATLIHILKRIIDKYGAVVEAGNFEDINQEAKDEINQLGQELLIIGMPILLLSQDPDFARSHEKLLLEVRLKAYDGIKRTVARLSDELQ